MSETELSDKVAIVTSTLYKPSSEADIVRFNLAKKSVETASELGYKFFIVDSESPEEFLMELEKRGAEVHQISKENSMGKKRRVAIEFAYNTGREIIAWTEPEKYPYISEISKTAMPIIGGFADLVVPRRTSLDSYPIAQQYAEPLGNLFWKSLTGQDLDVWFGPRTWKREMSDYFLNYNGEYGDLWDCIFVPIMDAVCNGKRVQSVDVDYIHPKEQTEIEEGNPNFDIKRVDQLSNLMHALKNRWEELQRKGS